MVLVCVRSWYRSLGSEDDALVRKARHILDDFDDIAPFTERLIFGEVDAHTAAFSLPELLTDETFMSDTGATIGAPNHGPTRASHRFENGPRKPRRAKTRYRNGAPARHKLHDDPVGIDHTDLLAACLATQPQRERAISAASQVVRAEAIHQAKLEATAFVRLRARQAVCHAAQLLQHHQ